MNYINTCNNTEELTNIMLSESRNKQKYSDSICVKSPNSKTNLWC